MSTYCTISVKATEVQNQITYYETEKFTVQDIYLTFNLAYKIIISPYIRQKHEAHVNNIQKINFYLTENMISG
jgi:hypothetical protein